MTATSSRRLSLICALVLICASSAASAFAFPPTAQLQNSFSTARFGERGLASVEDRSSSRTFAFEDDAFSLAIDGKDIRSVDLPRPSRRASLDRVEFDFTAQNFEIRVRYELRPTWHFVSKQIFVQRTGESNSFRVDSVTPIAARLSQSAQSTYVPRNRSWTKRASAKDFGIFLRFADHHGLLALAQNPFLDVTSDESSFSIRYSPDMLWDPRDGAFATDRVCLAPYTLSGYTVKVEMIPEWKLPP
ncbi:MAG TPA: hypothetical protein VFO34_07075, partial [Candidatus Acidoferrales bacterium]|nr:hypothetical protein [Candidatus Acidoferrales bacterium]